ncbi:MAG: UPF0280 family protein [Spirochaetales bacterium]
MEYRTFSYKETNLRFCVQNPEALIEEVRKQRKLLEAYIKQYPLFATSLIPISPQRNAPAIALQMHKASEQVGVGPMAAVAGAIAEKAARAGVGVVENGGDIFLYFSTAPVVVGLYVGKSALSGKIGFKIPPEQMPLAICSSSGTMGHSLSFGKADLVTVFASDGALADAAATLGGNLINTADDITPVLSHLCAIPGISAAWISVEGKVGFQGDLPPMVSLKDNKFYNKITRSPDRGAWIDLS